MKSLVLAAAAFMIAAYEPATAAGLKATDTGKNWVWEDKGCGRRCPDRPLVLRPQFMRPGAIQFGPGFNLPNSDEIGVALHRHRLEQESTPESARVSER